MPQEAEKLPKPEKQEKPIKENQALSVEDFQEKAETKVDKLKKSNAEKIDQLTEMVKDQPDSQLSKIQTKLKQMNLEAEENLKKLYSQLKQIKQSHSDLEPEKSFSQKTDALKKEKQEYSKNIAETSANIQTKIDILGETILMQKEKQEPNPEEIKLHLKNLMGSLHEFSNLADPLLDENQEHYKVLTEKMVNTIRLKLKVGDKNIEQIFSDVFHEFSDFIDEELGAGYIRGQREKGLPVNVEEASRFIYGRSSKEVERIKEKNRKQVVEKINELKEKGEIEIKDISDLHAIYNKSIVTKDMSQMRKSEYISFGKRVGTLPQDVEKEMLSLVERINTLFDKRALGMSKSLYTINVAKIHNIMLDIHPFADRNGSTALMLMEVLMAREGYTPSDKREKDYYKKVRKVLNNNPVAMATVGYEQFLINQKYGYYKGETTKKPEKQSLYEKMVNKKRQRIKDFKKQMKKYK